MGAVRLRVFLKMLYKISSFRQDTWQKTCTNTKTSELHTNNIRVKSGLVSRALNSRQERMSPLLRCVELGAASNPASYQTVTKNYLTRSFSLIAWIWLLITA